MCCFIPLVLGFVAGRSCDFRCDRSMTAGASTECAAKTDAVFPNAAADDIIHKKRGRLFDPIRDLQRFPLLSIECLCQSSCVFNLSRIPSSFARRLRPSSFQYVRLEWLTPTVRITPQNYNNSEGIYNT